jgi:hypothetical protein
VRRDIQVPLPLAPSTVSRSQDLIDIFWADATGRTMSAAWNPAQQWVGPWQIQAGRTRAGGNVTACCRAPNFLDIFIVGTDGQAYTAAWSPGAPWGGWWPIRASRPRRDTVSSPRSCDNLDVFAADGMGRTVVSRWMPGAAGWSAWQHIAGGMNRPFGLVDAVSRRDGRLDAFTTGTDRRVYRSEEAGTSAWGAWSTVTGLLAPVGAQVQAHSPGMDVIDLIMTDDAGAPAAARWEPDRPWTPWQSIGLL